MLEAILGISIFAVLAFGILSVRDKISGKKRNKLGKTGGAALADETLGGTMKKNIKLLPLGIGAVFFTLLAISLVMFFIRG